MSPNPVIITRMIYLASPYSYKSKIPGLAYLVRLYRNYMITKIAGALHDQFPDVAFILPITQSHQVAKYMKSNSTAFSAWASRDLEFISRCDAIWVVKMPGWKDSIGVQAEIKFSKKNKIPVKYIDYYTLKFEELQRDKKTKKQISKRSSKPIITPDAMLAQHGSY